MNNLESLQDNIDSNISDVWFVDWYAIDKRSPTEQRHVCILLFFVKSLQSRIPQCVVLLTQSRKAVSERASTGSGVSESNIPSGCASLIVLLGRPATPNWRQGRASNPPVSMRGWWPLLYLQPSPSQSPQGLRLQVPLRLQARQLLITYLWSHRSYKNAPRETSWLNKYFTFLFAKDVFNVSN